VAQRPGMYEYQVATPIRERAGVFFTTFLFTVVVVVGVGLFIVVVVGVEIVVVVVSPG
jgi:hypothetical protein